MKEYSVVVGVYNADTSAGRQHLGLAEALAKEGFKVEIAPCQYPRDRYLFHQDRYCTKKDHLGISEGGMFLAGEDYLLVSKKLPYFGWKELKLSREEREAAFRQIETFFPNTRIYPVSSGVPGESIGPISAGHIDPGVMLLPRSKILIVDRCVYVGIPHYQEEFEEMAEAEGLEVKFYSNPDVEEDSYENFPLNCLVLPKGDSEIIFANSKTPSFVRLLRNLDLEVRTVPFHHSTTWGGSIHCATNTKDDTRRIEDLVPDSRETRRGLFQLR